MSEENKNNTESEIILIEKKETFFKSKKFIALIIILTIILIPIIYLIINKDNTKEFQVKTMANMYTMMNITNEYRLGEIDELEFSKQYNKLMKKLSKLNTPNVLALENSISTYKMSCDMLMLNVLTNAEEGYNLRLFMDEDIDIMLDSMDAVKEELEELDKENDIDSDLSEDIRQEVLNLLDKIK